MDVTNRYVLEFAKQYAAEHPEARILDYGCGSGELVVVARAAGVDMVGADTFYGGSDARTEATRAGRLGAVVFEMAEGKLPFAGACFDLVVNNQVLEHVEDLDAVLGEIHRVLRPDGSLLSLFPSRDVIREGHIGIPFAHWFPKGSRARFYYAWALRSLGMGTWKEQAPSCREWASAKLRWIDDFTFYRTRDQIFRAFRRYFSSELVEPTYIRYRLGDTAGLAPLAKLLNVPGVARIAAAIFRKLAFLVILSRKEAA